MYSTIWINTFFFQAHHMDMFASPLDQRIDHPFLVPGVGSSAVPLNTEAHHRLWHATPERSEGAGTHGSQTISLMGIYLISQQKRI